MVKGGGYTRLGPLVKDEILAFRYREGRKIEARTLRWWNNRGTGSTCHFARHVEGRSSPSFFFSSLFIFSLSRFVKPRLGVREATHASNNVQQFPRAESSRVDPSRAESSRVSARCNRLRLFMPLLVHRTLNTRARHC